MLRLFMTFSGSKINNQQVNLEVSGLIAVLWWRKMFGVQLQVMFTFWFGQYGLTDEHLFCFISLLSLKQQGREKLSMQLRKNWKCCIVIFFSAFFSWYLLYPKLWFDAQFPKVVIGYFIFSSKFLSIFFMKQTQQLDAKMDTCVSGCPVNSLSFVPLAHHHLSSGNQQTKMHL